MKKRVVIILLTIVASIWLGYLFLLGCFLGFLTTRQLAGKSVGERGRVRSIIIPFRGKGIHLHHWLCSLGLIGFSSATGIYFLTSTITYGLLAGLVFQGIFCYSDWHIILVRRRQKRGGKPSLPPGEPAELVLSEIPLLAAPEGPGISQTDSSLDNGRTE